jgi:BirA family biotin operon repressor/biotin-[acetyl-CoA-carboxylase] ligase
MAPPYSVVRSAVTASTQDDARAAFRGEPVLVVADRQTAGRGRSGAAWETAPRAVAMSLALIPAWTAERWGAIPLTAGVAACRWLPVGLKWPNDLIRHGDKVGGILVEASEGVVIVGMGVNLWWPEPPAGVGAIDDTDPGPALGAELAGAWAADLLTLLAGSDWPRDEYRSASVTLGEVITWSTAGDTTSSGRAIDVGHDGALVVDTGAGIVEIRTGAVTHVRVSPGSPPGGRGGDL